MNINITHSNSHQYQYRLTSAEILKFDVKELTKLKNLTKL